jgi:putative IMPACT (imprinted ancient) family translation regulator
MDLGIEADITVAYSDLQKLKYYFETQNIKIVGSYFNENVKVIFEISKYKYKELLESIEKLNFKILSINILKSKYIENYKKM